MEVNRVVPGSERLAVVRVHHVRLAFLEARQAGPVATALNAKAAGYPRAETFRPGDLPDKVHLLGLVIGFKAFRSFASLSVAVLRWSARHQFGFASGICFASLLAFACVRAYFKSCVLASLCR